MMKKMPHLPNAQKCTGCSACASICSTHAIGMAFDEEGFAQPQINQNTCVRCLACQQVCPILHTDEIPSTPYISTYAGYRTDIEKNKGTTSGGIATLLSEKMIAAEGLVAGVRYDEAYVHAYYTLAETQEDLICFSGSKYVQSEKKNIYQDVIKVLQTGREVLFIGCPCDVAAMIQMAKRKKVQEALTTCEVVCMGVTSYRIGADYKEYAEKKYGQHIVRMNARSKEKGWFVPHLEVEYQNGKVRYETLFGSYYGRGFQVYNRRSCFACPFRSTNGYGDIRLGDYWGIQKKDAFWNPNGVSCIFVRTLKGQNALRAISSDELALFKSDYQKATQNNMSSHRDKGPKYEKLRMDFAKAYQQKGLVYACRQTEDIGVKIKCGCRHHYVSLQNRSIIK